MTLSIRARAALLAPLAGLSLAAVVLAGCSSGGRVAYQAGVDRSTPERTYEFFKAAANARAFEDEWLVFSPNFKRALNQAVGRNVDFSDYTTARNLIATNSQADMQMLLNSKLESVQMTGPDSAMITITAGGQTLRPRMVRLLSWELRVKGDPQPFTDVLASGGAVQPGPGGSIDVVIPASPTMAPLLRGIPPQNIESLSLESRWYVDDFGGLEGALGAGAATPGPAQPTQPGQPTQPQQPTQPSPLAPPPPGGYGSPDG